VGEYATSIDIEATPDVVFALLPTPDGMVTWMGQYANLQPIPGGSFTVDINGTPIRGSYLEVDPPHRVVVSWGVAGSEEHPPGSSRVEFTLVASSGGTRLEVVHSGLPDSRTSMHASGWEHFLECLVVASVGGDPGFDPWAPWASCDPRPR